MNKIILECGSSYATKSAIKVLSEHLYFKKCTLNVYPQPVDSDDPETWALIFDAIGDNDLGYVRIYANMVTCGYGGEGPNDLLSILKYTGFESLFDSNRVFSSQHLVDSLTKPST